MPQKAAFLLGGFEVRETGRETCPDIRQEAYRREAQVGQQ